MPNMLILCADSDRAKLLREVCDDLNVEKVEIHTDWSIYLASVKNLTSGTWLIMSAQMLGSGGFERLLLTHDALSQTPASTIPCLMVEPDYVDERESIRQILGITDCIDAPLNVANVRNQCARLLELRFDHKTSQSSSVSEEIVELPRSVEVPLELNSFKLDMIFPKKGKLNADGMMLPRLLYILCQRNESGLLKLTSHLGKELVVAVLKGNIGSIKNTACATKESFYSAFGWSDTTYLFSPQSVVSHTFLPFGEKRTGVIVAGLMTLSINVIASRISDDFIRVVVLSEILDTSFGELFRQRGFYEKFAELCDGKQTLEQVIANVGVSTSVIMPWILFARSLDLILLKDSPTEQTSKFKVVYDIEPADPLWKPELIAPMTVEQQAVYSELEYKLKFLKDNDSYTVFQLLPGCGTAQVKAQFVDMVKDNHPDVYGGNVHTSVKTMAEEVFIFLKRDYEKLLASESGASSGLAESSRNTLSSASSLASTRSGKQSVVSGTYSAPRSPKLRRSGRQRPSSGVTGKLSSEANQEPSLSESPATSPSSTSDNIYESKSASRPVSSVSRPVSSVSRPVSSVSRPVSSVSRPVSSVKTAEAESGGAEKDLSKSQKTKSPSSATRVSSGQTRPVTRPNSRVTKNGQPSGPISRKTRSNRPKSGKTGARKAPILPKGKSRDTLRLQFKPEQHFKNGQKYLRSGRFSHAVEAFRLASSMEEKNGHFKAHHALALYRMDPSQKLTAISNLKEAAKMEGGGRDSFLFLGQIAKEDGEADKAHRFFKKVLDTDPKCIEALREMRLYNMRSKEPSTSATNGSVAQSIEDALEQETTSSGSAGLFSRFKKALFKKR